MKKLMTFYVVTGLWTIYLYFQVPMKSRYFLLFTVLLFSALPLWAVQPYLTNPFVPPPRTIRVCCMFGSNVSIVVLPFIKLTEVTSPEHLGAHHFLGKTSENNGIIYTHHGGFIDMGHLRDQADWTAYLYALMQQEKQLGQISIDLAYEGGNRKLKISIPPGMSDNDLILLAGRMAFDISAWHEIATWFGVCTVPLISEQFSSFSIEDGYSNLLGVFTGMKAIKSNLPYEEAMTMLIQEELHERGAVQSESETLQAMEDVRDIWWTRNELLPNNLVQLLRLTTTYDTIFPKLIPRDELKIKHATGLIVPSLTSKGDSLTKLYELSINLNYKFPVKKLFPKRSDRTITQKDFPAMIHYIDSQLDNGFLIKPET